MGFQNCYSLFEITVKPLIKHLPTEFCNTKHTSTDHDGVAFQDICPKEHLLPNIEAISGKISTSCSHFVGMTG